MESEKFELFGDCILCHGYSNSLIYDFGNEEYYNVPKKMSSILELYLENNNIEVKDQINIDKLLKELVKAKLGLYTKSPDRKLLLNINVIWSHPWKISNCIFYPDSVVMDDIISALEDLNCQNIQLRFNRSIGISDLVKISDSIINSSIKTCEILSKYSDQVLSACINEICEYNKRFRRFFFYGSPINESLNYMCAKGLNSMQKSFDICCIHADYFSINIPLFTESQHFNTCLNRKLCIDKDGYIKNCPYMEHHYGHISNTKIEDVIALPEFQKWWHIKKDDIDVCKDCEFRHMCTDCRAFIKDPENIYSQPSKCTYNPYICKWEGEEGYVPVEECGTYSRETGFVPDKKKIKKLNKQIWGDE